MPRSIRQRMVGYRLGFSLVVAGLVWMVWSIRGSYLVDDEGNTNVEAAIGTSFCVALTMAAFFLVQGSDPGYLWDERLARLELEARAGVRQWKRAHEATGDGRSGALHRDEHVLREPTAASGAAAAATAAGGDEQPAGAATSVEGAVLGPGVDRLSGDEEAAEEDEPLVFDFVDAYKTPGSPPFEGVPVRAHFCKVSKLWVHGFDHYCGTLGTTIGERNHCRFWWLLFFATVTLAVGISISGSSFRHEASFVTWYMRNRLAFWTSLVLWLTQAFVFPLWLVHSWLAVTNSTTQELFRDPRRHWYLRHRRTCDYPFSINPLENLRMFCCVRDGLCSQLYAKPWRPRRYRVPQAAVRDSTDVLAHPWENRYYSCC